MPAIFDRVKTLEPTAPSPVKVKFHFEKQENGKYSLHGVPIFQTHDDRGFDCDELWMIKAVETQRAEKEKGFLPRLIIGHTTGDPESPEKPVEAYLDNYRFDPETGWLFADYVDIPEQLMEQFVEGKWPGRSVEIIPEEPAVRTVAILGGNRPFFKLPDTRFEGKKTQLIYQEINYMPDDDTKKPDEKFNEGTPEGISDEELPQFQTFVRFMKAFEGMKAPAPAADPDPNQFQGDPESEEEKKKKEGQFQATASDADKRYAEVTARCDKLEKQNAALEMSNEHARWTKVYADKRVPATRLNVEEQVEFTMKLPANVRQEYADRFLKTIDAPSTSTIDTDDHHVDTGVAAQAKRYEELQAEWAKPEVKKVHITYGNFLASKAS